MSIINQSPGTDLFYQVDDFTDPWRQSEWVVFVHGAAESGAAWFAWVPAFARHFRILRPDLRGFGRSSPMAEAHHWTLDELCSDLALVADHLGIARFHLIGAKIGGTMGLHFAATHPDRCASLTVLAAPMVGRGQVAGKLDSWIEHIRKNGTESWAQASIAGRLGSSTPPRAQEWWSRMMGHTSPSSMIGFFRSIASIDIEAELPRIACPTLVVTTQGNLLGDVDEISRWQRMIPRSELTVIPSDSYHVAASDADEAARRTLAFIKRTQESG